jgi:hypothetical protein
MGKVSRSNRAAIIIPAVGTRHLQRAVRAARHQSHRADVYVVVDGPIRSDAVDTAVVEGITGLPYCCVIELPENTGGTGYCGHRIYAAMSFLVNAAFVFFCDEDAWYEPTHVQTCVATMQQNKWDWCHSLRNIADSTGKVVCRDECESLGRKPGINGACHIDTSCFALRTPVAMAVAAAHVAGPHGHDRWLYRILNDRFPQYGSTNKYTVNYSMSDRPGAPTPEDFVKGNAAMRHAGI